ncbi:MAG: dihydroneopterin aldolase [Candidatus Neomarinimicrobiota bacterium]|nr:MAG: dihydroneopterin aldolase [Candidatus Neomarinimicrobiota bacterium]
MDVIRLKNMVFYGYHGVSDTEKDLGGKFEVDLELFLPLKKPGQTDSLKDTLDYVAIYQTVGACTRNQKFYLIEALAETIARTLLTNFPLDQLVVRVRKPHAPIQGVLDSVEVEIKRNRDYYV